MVLLVMAIAATLAVPAFARFGTEQPTRGADAMLGLLRDARKASIDYNATVTLRLDPKTLKYQVDTSTANGAGVLATRHARPGSHGDARQRPDRAAVHLPSDRRGIRRQRRRARRTRFRSSCAWIPGAEWRVPTRASSARSSRPGFSLLEAVAAIAIVGMTAVSALEGGRQRACARPRRRVARSRRKRSRRRGWISWTC